MHPASQVASHDVRDALIAELKDRIRYLEEGSRRKDTVLLSLSEGLKALVEAPREVRGSSDTVTDEQGDSTVQRLLSAPGYAGSSASNPRSPPR